MEHFEKHVEFILLCVHIIFVIEILKVNQLFALQRNTIYEFGIKLTLDLLGTLHISMNLYTLTNALIFNSFNFHEGVLVIQFRYFGNFQVSQFYFVQTSVYLLSDLQTLFQYFILTFVLYLVVIQDFYAFI